MIYKTLIFLTLFLSYLHAQDVQTLLQKLPASSAAERDSVSAAFLDFGEAAILDLCQELRPAGEEDTAAKFAISGLCDYASQAGAAQKSLVADALVKALAKAENWQVRAFLIEQLTLIGEVSHAEALAPYLQDEQLCDPAARALVVIGQKRGEKLLIDALDGASGLQWRTIINALGEIGSYDAAPRLLKMLEHSTGEPDDVLLYALARSGHPSAGPVLLKQAEKATGFVRQKAFSYYFDFIKKQPEDKAAKLYRDLLAVNPPSHIVCRALSGLFELQQADALEDILTAVQRDEIDILACGLRLTRSLGDEEISRTWINVARNAVPEKRALIVRELGRRKHTASVDYVSAALNDGDLDVRLAAITALARLKGAEAAPQLFEVLANQGAEEAETAVKALSSYTSDASLVAELAGRIAKLPYASQAQVIQLFADRRAEQQKELISDLAMAGDHQVRSAAFGALATMASARDVAKLLEFVKATQDGEELARLQDGLVRAAGDSDSSVATLIIKALHTSSGEQVATLLGALSRLNNAEALRAVLEATTEQTTRRDAVQAFAEGPQAPAIPALLTILEDVDDALRPMAFQKVVRLLRNGRGMSTEMRLQHLKKLMSLARDGQEKRDVLSIAGNIHTIESLRILEPHLEYSATQQAAADAVVNAALPQRKSDTGLHSPEAVRILYKALALPGNEERNERIKTFLDNIGSGRGIDLQTGARLNEPPPGFVRLFNGRDLSGWKGLTGKGGNPYEREKLSPDEMTAEQARADSIMRAHWRVESGMLIFDGHGSHLCTQKEYRNFELLVDWKIGPGGDSGIYLRGAPQVQIWDPAQWPEGSGGLYNNKKGPSKPLVRADNPIGEWNTFRIKMIDDRVTVYLNGTLVVDNVVLENYWDRSQPIFPKGQIELQSHGSTLYFRNIFIREIFAEEDGWASLFDGQTLKGWTGSVNGYAVENGAIVCKPGSGGNLFTENLYNDFEFVFEFRLTPGANSGLGIRAPLKGDAAYKGMELQILDNSAIRYAKLKPYQYHGSIYGVVPAKRGYLKPVGEWNVQHVRVKGDSIRVELNGVTIVDADISQPRRQGTMDHRKHPGLKRKKGHIGFLGHDAHVEFRNINVRKIEK